MGDLTGGAIKKVCVEPYYLTAARRRRITLPAVMAEAETMLIKETLFPLP